MKTISKLTGVLTETDFREPRGILQSVHVEPIPGIHLRVNLGSAGVMISRNQTAALAIPLDEFVTLAAAHCPELLELQPAAKQAAVEAAAQLSAHSKPISGGGAIVRAKAIAEAFSKSQDVKRDTH